MSIRRWLTEVMCFTDLDFEEGQSSHRHTSTFGQHPMEGLLTTSGTKACLFPLILRHLSFLAFCPLARTVGLPLWYDCVGSRLRM